jgi:hypothetical protein
MQPLRAGVHETQDDGRQIGGHAHDRRHPAQLGHPHHVLAVARLERPVFAVEDNEIPRLIAQHFHQASVRVAHKASESCFTRFELGFGRIRSQGSPHLRKGLNRSGPVDYVW